MYSKLVSFIQELYATQDFVPLHAPVFGGNEKKYVAECIDSTFVSSVGSFVNQFESMLANYTGANSAVACVNGTSALHIALKLVGVQNNTEVITQPLTFIATANAISYCGAVPVFVDVDKQTMGMSAQALQTWLEANVLLQDTCSVNKHTGRTIAACVPMHTFGQVCSIVDIVNICNEYHIPVVEDAAESLGSFFDGQHTGTFGNIGIVSFNGNKTITTGGGGMLLFSDNEQAAYAKHITTQAKVPHAWEFAHDAIGYNYRLPNINAALGCAQMEKLPEYIRKKRELAAQYKQFFQAYADVAFCEESEKSQSNYWLNTIVVKDIESRNACLEYTNAHGVMTRPAWQLMNTLPMFSHCQCGDLSQARWLADRIINLPSSVRL